MARSQKKQEPAGGSQHLTASISSELASQVCSCCQVAVRPAARAPAAALLWGKSWSRLFWRPSASPGSEAASSALPHPPQGLEGHQTAANYRSPFASSQHRIFRPLGVSLLTVSRNWKRRGLVWFYFILLFSTPGYCHYLLLLLLLSLLTAKTEFAGWDQRTSGILNKSRVSSVFWFISCWDVEDTIQSPSILNPSMCPVPEGLQKMVMVWANHPFHLPIEA